MPLEASLAVRSSHDEVQRARTLTFLWHVEGPRPSPATELACFGVETCHTGLAVFQVSPTIASDSSKASLDSCKLAASISPVSSGTSWKELPLDRVLAGVVDHGLQIVDRSDHCPLCLSLAWMSAKPIIPLVTEQLPHLRSLSAVEQVDEIQNSAQAA